MIWVDEATPYTKSQEEYLKMKTENFNNKLLVTHTDLDGMGCAVIFLKCFPTGEVIFADYDNVDLKISQLLLEDKDWDILITDISVNERVASLLESRGKVGLLDHHATASWLGDKYQWANIALDQCGTRMIYEMFCRYFNIQDYETFVDTVECWDMWGKVNGKQVNEGPLPSSVNLSLLFDFIGRNRFIERMVKDPNDGQDKELGDILWEKFITYYDETFERIQLHEKDGYRVGICVAEQYKSLLGDRLIRDLDLEYVMILDPRMGKGSLRGRGNIDLSELAKQAGGGGHRRAAGFPLGAGAVQLVSMVETE